VRHDQAKKGRVAQLGERCVRNAEVASSILAASTNLRLGQRFVLAIPVSDRLKD
jgi:hypothetical protein